MSPLRTSSVIGLVALVAGCVVGYPSEIVGIGDSPNFPLRAAGFMRGRIVAYDASFSVISTGYDYAGPDAQISATIYLTTQKSQQSDIRQRFEAEKAAVEQFHPGARLVREEQVVLSKHGVTYRALKASYEFDGIFWREQKHLYSELWLWLRDDKFIKFRSTAPFDQRSIAVIKNFELLDAVDWAPQPQIPAETTPRRVERLPAG